MSFEQVIDLAAGICREFEGFRARPYLCPAGVWTIGYGTTRYEDGRPVAPGDLAVDVGRAESLLQHELRSALAGVLTASPNLATAHPARLAAILDFVYNLGIGRYRASTLRKRAEALDWAGACTELMKWVMGGGRVLPGLERRRRAEVSLIKSASLGGQP